MSSFINKNLSFKDGIKPLGLGLKYNLTHSLTNSIWIIGYFLVPFKNGKPIKHNFDACHQLPTESEELRAMSKELKKRGFKFVGPRVCYTFMQAVGIVNDHLMRCFRYDQIESMK